MSLSSTTVRNDYQGTNGVGPFAYGFRIFASTDLEVVKRSSTGDETTLTYGADYTVTGAGNRAGGSVTLSAPLTPGETLTIRRNPPLTQPTDLRNAGGFFPETLEDQFDRLTMMVQALQEHLSRALTLAVTQDPTNYSLALPLPAEGQVLTGAGDRFVMAALTGTMLETDRIPIVANAAARELAFPVATRSVNQRVFRVDDRVTERWDGAAWAIDMIPLPELDGIVDASTRTIALEAVHARSSHRAIGGYPPNGVTLLGDSITANLGVLSNWFGADAAAWVNAGVGGNTSDQVLARVDADVSRANCDTCLLMVGINDFISGQTPENVLGYIQQIVAKLVKKDIRPLLGTVLPTRSDYANAATLSAKTITLNNLLRTYAAENGIVLVDYYTAFLDPAGGPYADATLLNADGLHPNDATGNVLLTSMQSAALKLDEFRASIHRVLALLSAGPVIANGGIVLGGAGSTTALDYSAAFGIFLRGKAGAQYDWSVFTPGGNPAGGLLPGTVNLQWEGMIQSKARLLSAYENVVYGPNMSPNAALGNRSVISANNGVAFTIAAPTNPLDGQRLTITIRNVSGGALGAATWNAIFKMAAWTQPANGFSRSITFEYNGANWIEVSRTPADVPN